MGEHPAAVIRARGKQAGKRANRSDQGVGEMTAFWGRGGL